MAEYLFRLGNHPELSWGELRTVVTQTWPGTVPARLSDNWARLELSSKTDKNIHRVQARLGGVVKILIKVGEIAELTPAKIGLAVADKLPSKMKFTLQWMSQMPNNRDRTGFHYELKQILANPDRKVEYTTRPGQMACAHLSENFFEWWLTPGKRACSIYQTVAWQDIDEWSRRDRARPYSAGDRGMLPLKVARMMINTVSRGWPTPQQTVYDPFCGTGSVLMEAGVLGYALVGSDIATDQVSGTERNLLWLADKMKAKLNYRLYTHDAAQINSLIKPESIELVVTEPYLGPAYVGEKHRIMLKGHSVSTGKLKRVFRGLVKLYTGSLMRWQQYLVSGGRVALVLPEVAGVKIAQPLIDSCETLGYTLLADGQVYSRPEAVVKRTIYFLQKG